MWIGWVSRLIKFQRKFSLFNTSTRRSNRSVVAGVFCCSNRRVVSTERERTNEMIFRRESSVFRSFAGGRIEKEKIFGQTNHFVAAFFHIYFFAFFSPLSCRQSRISLMCGVGKSKKFSCIEESLSRSELRRRRARENSITLNFPNQWRGSKFNAHKYNVSRRPESSKYGSKRTSEQKKEWKWEWINIWKLLPLLRTFFLPARSAPLRLPLRVGALSISFSFAPTSCPCFISSPSTSFHIFKFPLRFISSPQWLSFFYLSIAFFSPAWCSNAVNGLCVWTLSERF